MPGGDKVAPVPSEEGEEREDAERPARAQGVRDDERHVSGDEAEVVRRVADARSVAQDFGRGGRGEQFGG